jgi:hypothetical protein
MTGVVLALAGLACGDGGPGTGAERALVAVSLDGDWEGTWDIGNGRPYRVVMRGRRLRFAGDDNDVYRVTSRSVPDGGAEGWITMENHYRGVLVTGRGIYKAESGRLLICVTFWSSEPRPALFEITKNTILVTLRPAPPKP